jgi:SOS-response transcriptional repressor LexA
MNKTLGEKRPRCPRKDVKAGSMLGIVSSSAACASPDAQIACTPQDIALLAGYRKLTGLEQRHGPRTYALRVRGESMRNPGNKPSFEDGDIIFVDPDLEASHNSLVITKVDQSNEVTFKRLLIDGPSWYLEALNPSWPNRIISIETDAHVCGVVIARLESFI